MHLKIKNSLPWGPGPTVRISACHADGEGSTPSGPAITELMLISIFAEQLNRLKYQTKSGDCGFKSHLRQSELSHICASGEIGRRTILRGWRPQGHVGSSPTLRTKWRAVIMASRAVLKTVGEQSLQGSSPWPSAKIEGWPSGRWRWSRKPEYHLCIVGSNPTPSARDIPVAQLDQSMWLRTTRLRVQVLPGMPDIGSVSEVVERSGLQHRWSNPTWVRIPPDPPDKFDKGGTYYVFR